MKINIKKIKIYGYHGIEKIEKEKGQDFIVDIVLKTDFNFNKDHIEETVDYAKIINITVEIFRKNRCDLLETLIKKISDKILENKRISEIEISISKLNPPIKHVLESVGVTMKIKND